MPLGPSARPRFAARLLPLLDRLQLLLDRSRLRRSRSISVDGMWVGYRGDDEFPKVFERVEEALGLIKRHDPVRYARLLRDVDRIWVTLVPASRAQYKHALRLCELDQRFVLGEAPQPETIASIIVHESTHARLMHCGIGYEPDLRARVERVCIRRQRAFAAKLPRGEQVEAEADWALTEVPPDYWTNEAFRDRAIQGGVENLRFIGTPEVVIRALLGLGALLTRVRNRRKLGRAFRAKP